MLFFLSVSLNKLMYLDVSPQVWSSTVPRGSLCGWAVMTRSLKAAGSGRTVLLSDSSTGTQVSLQTDASLHGLTYGDDDDGGELNSLSWPQLFLTGNPDDYYGEDCLSIIINNGYWNDDNCENKRGYICKRRGETCCFTGLCWWKVIFKSWCILVTLSSCRLFQV